MSVRLAIMVEGKTEKAFMPVLRRFLATRLAGRMPKLVLNIFVGRLPKGDELRRRTRLLLATSADHVIALTDVCTGSADFQHAEDAKQKMREWAEYNSCFHAHVALHEFEAWLLPYWSTIQNRAGSNRTMPAANPETVNHGKPPSRHLDEVYRTGSRGRRYVKTIEVSQILKDADLLVAASACPELKAFLNTILTLAGGSPL